jgi:hypothetical protein
VDNFGVFIVEEGLLSEEEIVQTLKSQIDKEWQWKLMKMDEYRYLVKFPPHIKVESKVLGKATYFYLKNDEVMASLRVWNCDIEPMGQLEEVWVQITGVPPKWCNWTTINEIASSLGKMGEIDWQMLFSSFFSTIRVKIHCKDPDMIPESRIMEMDNNLFLIHFKVETKGKEHEKPGGDEGKGDNPDEEDDNPEDDPEKPFEAEGDEEKDRNDKSKDKADRDKSKEGSLGNCKSAQKTNSVVRTLFVAEDKELQGLRREGSELCGGVNLLQAMEVEEPG